MNATPKQSKLKDHSCWPQGRGEHSEPCGATASDCTKIIFKGSGAPGSSAKRSATVACRRKREAVSALADTLEGVRYFRAISNSASHGNVAVARAQASIALKAVERLLVPWLDAVDGKDDAAFDALCAGVQKELKLIRRERMAPAAEASLDEKVLATVTRLADVFGRPPTKREVRQALLHGTTNGRPRPKDKSEIRRAKSAGSVMLHTHVVSDQNLRASLISLGLDWLPTERGPRVKSN